MARRVIINADDFGWSPGVTDGVLRASRDGVVTSATLAANMPDAARAAALAAELPSLGVGVHLNACQGPPLSEAGRRLADDDGIMRSTAPALIGRCVRRPWLIRSVLAEFDAQIRRALDHGVKPTHLDSHRHVHAFTPIFVGTVRLAKRYGIRWIRRPREKLPGADWPAAAAGPKRTSRLLNLMCVANILIGRSQTATTGLWGVSHTGCITAEWLILAAGMLPEGTTEIMTHPGYPHDLEATETRLTDSRRRELEALCDPAVRAALQRNRLELVQYGRIGRVMVSVGDSFEMVFVNDGSDDDTAEILAAIAEADERVCFIDLRRNFGQTTAIQAGFDHARGEILVAMDGDLQHDPHEIPLLLAKIDEGYDIASGWRRRRGDGLMSRRLPSRIANRLLAKVSGVPLRDFGTTFKAYRREVLEGVRLYGDMHRFVPAVCARLGAKICEVPIKNVRRRAGKSNYGIGRTFRVALDILTLRFISAYLTRPLHFFGKAALVGFVLGGGVLAYGFVRKILQWSTFDLFSEHGPLMAVGFISVIAALLFLSTGLIGELLMRVYFESTPAKTYAIRRIVRHSAERQPRGTAE